MANETETTAAAADTTTAATQAAATAASAAAAPIADAVEAAKAAAEAADAGKAAADKAAADKAAADAAQPIVYEAFKLPEGIALDEAALGEVMPLFQEARLPQAQAQKMVDLHIKVLKAGAEAAAAANAAAWAASKQGWQTELKADPEYGGANLQETTSSVAKAIDGYGGKDAPVLREFMKTYGLGDHPAFARFLARVGRTVREDNVPRANGAGQVSVTAQGMYPNSNMNP